VEGGGQRIQNVLILASQQSWRDFLKADDYALTGWQTPLVRRHLPYSAWPAKGAVFTDDRNPVEAIIADGLMSEG
jgi:hypothetical protein